MGHCCGDCIHFVSEDVGCALEEGNGYEFATIDWMYKREKGIGEDCLVDNECEFYDD